MDPNAFLSPNFRLFEFTTSPTADRNGIDNKPNAKETANLKKLCKQILQPAREALGPLKINSGFRNEALNNLVGGVPTSDHRLGFAADVVPMDGNTRGLAEWVVKNCPKFDQVILEFGTPEQPRWIHLSVAPANRKEVLRAEKVGTKTVYSKIVL
jgi:hypothetical protein